MLIIINRLLKVTVLVFLAFFSWLQNPFGDVELIAEDSSFKPKMSFQKAAGPYTNEKYDKNGYVKKDGTIGGNGLGCSGYASVVIQRMKYGDNWKDSYSLTPHKWYGDKFAKHYDFKLKAKIPANVFNDKNKLKTDYLDNDKLKKNGLYYFNVRKGIHGHVGFFRIKSDGRVIQSQYSGLEGINGLATGSPAKWIGKSRYKASEFELYLVNEPE